MGRRVAIVGVALTKCSSHRRDVTYPELVHEAVSGALADAGIGFEQIEAVVYGSMDPFDGVFAPPRWTVDSCVSAGFLNKPFLKITTGGTTGGSPAPGAYHHVGSGMFDVVPAGGSQRGGEANQGQA